MISRELLDRDKPPLVLHVIYRLSVGGLENGLVNLINSMSRHRYRHAIVCLTDFTDFRDRIRWTDVPVIALHKREGHDPRVYTRLWRVLRHLRPDIVHTRNLSSLECLIPAALVGVPGRVHGEHGRDMYDLDGSSLKYNLLRKGLRRLVHQYIAVSADLASWLVHTVGVCRERVWQIYNGVDIERFQPRIGLRRSLGLEGLIPRGAFVVGTVGRMYAVKDQLTLVQAFLHMMESDPSVRDHVRLVMVGEGPLREESLKLLRAAQVDHLAWLPGERVDIPDIMRALDVFVLPSLAEGISNTILEAMASGLPVVATRVGGNPELVDEGKTGMLVPPANPKALAEAIRTYLLDREQGSRHGQAGRKTAEVQFSMEAMVNGYLRVYDTVLGRRGDRGSVRSAKIPCPVDIHR